MAFCNQLHADITDATCYTVDSFTHCSQARVTAGASNVKVVATYTVQHQ